MGNNIYSNKVMAVVLAIIVSILWGTLFPMIKIGYKVFGIEATVVRGLKKLLSMRVFECY